MHPFPYKVINLIPPVAIVDNASWTTTEIDTRGFDFAAIFINLGASDIAVAALAVTESDASGSGHANVTGLVYGTSTNTDGSTSALPTALEDGLVFGFLIDLRARKRYIDVTATAGDGTAGTFASGLAFLGKAEELPITAANMGCSQLLQV